MLATWLLASVWVTLTWALPKNRTDPLTGAAIDSGSFKCPSAKVRPRFRYWIPDASIDLGRMAEDIAQVKSAGAGGVELLGYYLYGGQNLFPGTALTGAQPQSDWDVYGWGTPAWAQLFKAAAQAHKDNDLIMDFALGPNQGQGVPAPADSEGLAWDLFSYNVTVIPGQSFTGKIPGWGEGTLIGLTSAAVIDSQPFNNTIASFTGGVNTYQHINYTLAASSLIDHTTQVSADGSFDYAFPANSSVQQYRLFASYIRHSEARAQISGPDPQGFLQNGSFAVDHFSALGGETTAKFWENYVLINGSLDLVRDIGNYVWEDSIEILSNLYWTEELPEAFMGDHGYSIITYISLLLNGNNPSVLEQVYTPQGPTELFWTDDSDGGQSHVDDYRTTLGRLYDTYTSYLTSWAKTSLDMQCSMQVAYNLPVDVLSSVPYVDAPELESLGFDRQIDSYRQYVGPANLADKRVISSELGAVMGKVWQLFLPELLFDVKRSFAAGVNQMVFHGLQFSGNYPNTTWPGFTTFWYLYSEMHGRHQPAWAYYSDILDYVARLQFSMQIGTPKRDLAIWQKDTRTVITAVDYNADDLASHGYGYEYLSPDNFALPQAAIQNSTLAGDGPAYKALLVRGNDSMTTFGASKLLEFAQAGLTIILQGGIPEHFVGYAPTQQEASASALQQLTSLANVHQIGYNDSVAEVLLQIGNKPRTEVLATNTWYTYWRHDSTNGLDYVYIYNDLGPDSTGTVTFDSGGIPYYFDAWTGAQTAVNNYTRTNDGRTTLYIELAANQTTLIVFADEPLAGVPLPKKGPYLSAHEGFVDDDGTLYLKELADTINLTNWDLRITEWAPPADLYDASMIANYKNHSFELSSLEAWSTLTGMYNVSGTGVYTAHFETPIDCNATMIDFGKVVHTLRVRVNGVTIPQLDVVNARGDITRYLNPAVGSDNTIEAEVSTPLFNELKPIADQLLSSNGNAVIVTAFGGGVNATAPSQLYGLLDPVTVSFYHLKAASY